MWECPFCNKTNDSDESAFCSGCLKRESFIDREKRLKEEGSVEDILYNDLFDEARKRMLIAKNFQYTSAEIDDLFKVKDAAIRKARLGSIKRKIFKKGYEKYGGILSNSREPIPSEVQEAVWQRDGGKCVKCGSQEKLEFDHIIPVVKGGSNTARNIQLLCEKCNRGKSSNIG